MTDRPSDSKPLAELFANVYPNILSAEQHQCKSFLEDALAELYQQIAYIEVEAFENISAEMSYRVNEKLQPSLDELIQTIREWVEYKKFSGLSILINRLYYINEVEYIEKCYFATSILRPINQYLKAVSFESNKSYFKEKVDDLKEGINYIKSPEVFDALYARFDNKVKKILDKLDKLDELTRNDKFKDDPISYSAKLKAAIDEIRLSLQEASNDIEDIIKYLLKNPEKNIKQVNKIIGIEDDYSDNKK
jgi:hypothetical protein